MHTDARPSMPSHRYTHAYTSIHTRMREGLAADERRWSRRCASARAHLGIRTRLDARASIQTHVVQMGITHPPARTRTRTRSRSHGFCIRTHTYTYGLTRTHIYVKSCGRARPRHSRRALTRPYAHAHTRKHVLYTCSLTYTYGLKQTQMYMYVVTHICMCMRSHLDVPTYMCA